MDQQTALILMAIRNKVWNLQLVKVGIYQASSVEIFSVQVIQITE